MESPLDHILGRPAMYAGVDLSSIEQFNLFFCGIGFGLTLRAAIPEADLAAVTHFSVFMRYYLHGENKNCHWAYDLLSREGSHSVAVKKASALMKIFRDRISKHGLDGLPKILENASSISLTWDKAGYFSED